MSFSSCCRCVLRRSRIMVRRVGLSSPVDQWTFMRALTGTDQHMTIQISVPMHQFRDMNSETAAYVWVFGILKISTRSEYFAYWVSSIMVRITLFNDAVSSEEEFENSLRMLNRERFKRGRSFPMWIYYSGIRRKRWKICNFTSICTVYSATGC